jgi:hypothetical protein
MYMIRGTPGRKHFASVSAVARAAKFCLRFSSISG